MPFLACTLPVSQDGTAFALARTELVAGSYIQQPRPHKLNLAGLSELSLYGNTFTQLPSALTAATALQALDIAQQQQNRFQLSSEDLELLGSLPCLKWFSPLTDECRARLPHVQECSRPSWF